VQKVCLENFLGIRQLGGQAGRISRLRQQTKQKTGVRPGGLTRQLLAVAWSGLPA